MIRNYLFFLRSHFVCRKIISVYIFFFFLHICRKIISVYIFYFYSNPMLKICRLVHQHHLLMSSKNQHHLDHRMLWKEYHYMSFNRPRDHVERWTMISSKNQRWCIRIYHRLNVWTWTSWQIFTKYILPCKYSLSFLLDV